MLLSTKDKYQIQCAYKYFKDNCEVSYKEMQEGRLDMIGIKSYVRHTPVRSLNEGWPDWFYEMTDKLLYKVYEYSEQRGYIQKGSSLEEFLQMITRESNIVC